MTLYSKIFLAASASMTSDSVRMIGAYCNDVKFYGIEKLFMQFKSGNGCRQAVWLYRNIEKQTVQYTNTL